MMFRSSPSIFSRISAEWVLTVPSIRTWPAMIFRWVPPCMVPMVTARGYSGLLFLDT